MRRQGVMPRQGAMRRQGMCRRNASSDVPIVFIMYTRARPLGYPVAPCGISSRPRQVVEKVVEVPQVGSTTQGSVREEHVEGETKREEHPAQVVQQARHGQVSCDWDRLIRRSHISMSLWFLFF